MVILILIGLWVILAPLSILGKIGNMEERLKVDLKDSTRASENRLGRLEKSITEILLRMDKAAAPPLPEKPETSVTVTPVTILEPVHEEAPADPDLQEAAFTEAAPIEAKPMEAVEHVKPVPEPVAPREPIAAAFETREEFSVYKSSFFQASTDVAVSHEEMSETPPEHSAVSNKEWGPPLAAEDFEEAGIISLTINKFLSWLLAEGNIWVCTGVLLLLAGFGLLLRYAIRIGLMSLEMRLAAATLTGIVMTVLGFRLRERRRAYALILQGGGMGVLYLTVLGAAKLVPNAASLPILSPPFAVLAMLALSVFTVLLALLQNYQPLAIIAILGGFAAPLLISIGLNNHVTLFSVYTLLNLEILAISFRRDWRVLNRMGFVLTLAIGVTWGLRNWRPELFNSIEPFLLAFLLTYSLVSLNIGGRHAHGGRDSDGGSDFLLSLSTPFAFFFLQMKVAAHFRYGMALTCLGLGLLHFAIGAFLGSHSRKDGADELQNRGWMKGLPHLHMMLCLLFLNLTIPYTFEDKISSSIWAVEAAFLITVACRSGRYGVLLGGTMLHAGAMWLYIQELARVYQYTASRLSPLFISGVMFAASHWVSGFWASRFRPVEPDNPKHEEWETALQKFWSENSNSDGMWVRDALSWTFTVLGSLWWWRTVYDQVPRLGLPWFTVFSVMCLTAWAGCWMSVRYNWRAAKFPLALTVVFAFAGETLYHVSPFFRSFASLIFAVHNSVAPMGGLSAHGSESLTIWMNAASYIAGVGGSLWLLRRTAATTLSKAFLFASSYTGLILSARAARTFGLLAGGASDVDWGGFFFALPLLALLFFLRGVLSKNDIYEEYKRPVAASTGMFLVLQTMDFFVSFSSAGSKFLGAFIPVLNPLEMRQAAFLISLSLWFQIFVFDDRTFGKWTKQALVGIGALFFLWISQAAARATFWYWYAPPYDPWRVFTSPHCQAIVAIMWGTLGLLAILRGQKTRSRIMWTMGTGLLAMDMFKLLLVDLRGAETLTRVVAFLVLGGLFLMIGWLAPLPPKEEASQT